MAKACPDAVLDGFLDLIAAATGMSACSAQPTTRTEAVTTYMLATHVMTPGNGNGDFTIADDTSGRKLTMTAQADVTITNSGSATHIALTDATNILFVTTCTEQALVAEGTVTFPAWKINIPDPV